MSKIKSLEISNICREVRGRVRSVGDGTYVTVDHIEGSKLQDIFTCVDKNGKKRYFVVNLISDQEDVLKEMGYFANLLNKLSLEDAKNLVLGFELKLATEDEQKDAITENNWC